MTTRTLPPPAKTTAPPEPLDLVRQFDDLRALRDGWFDGAGAAPPSDGLDWLAEQFRANLPAAVPPPRLYPIPDGGVQAEWSLPPHEASADFDLVAKSAYWHCWNVETHGDEDRTLELSSAAGWRWLGDELARLTRAANDR